MMLRYKGIQGIQYDKGINMGNRTTRLNIGIQKLNIGLYSMTRVIMGKQDK